MKIFIAFLLAFVPAAYTAAVTHENIRDVMISFAHLARDIAQKLERHELRERQLGDQLKKALSGLDSRERLQDRLLENLAASVSSIDNRLKNLESIKNDDEESKNAYSVDSAPLENWKTQVQTLLNERDTVSNKKLDKLEHKFNTQMDHLTSIVEKLQAELEHLSSQISQLASLRHLHSQTDTRISLPNDWHDAITKELNLQSAMLKELVKKPDHLDNTTLEEVVAFRNEMVRKISDVLSLSEGKFDSILEHLNTNRRSVLASIKDINDGIADFSDSVGRRVDQISEDTKSIRKIDDALERTSENVMDTRRRVEYGVQRILQEVGEFLRSQGNDLNDTVNSKFGGITDTIMKFQDGAVGNISSKVESEISQVWRQIGSMHQQITSSANTLDKLKSETQVFMVESETKMDSMAVKLDSIASDVIQLQDNHNLLLGRLSLFTQEFNETRFALSEASKYLKEAYEAAKKAKEENQGRGPIYIEESENNLDENNL